MAPKTNGRGVQVEDTRICVVMVGLPARGKSYIAQKGNYQLPSCMLTELFAYPIHSIVSLLFRCLILSASPVVLTFSFFQFM